MKPEKLINTGEENHCTLNQLFVYNCITCKEYLHLINPFTPNDKNGYYRFDDEECWFRHERVLVNKPVESEGQSSELIERILV
jgi:hypothetical protein